MASWVLGSERSQEKGSLSVARLGGLAVALQERLCTVAPPGAEGTCAGGDPVRN